VPNIQSDNKIEVQLMEEEGLNVFRSKETSPLITVCVCACVSARVSSSRAAHVTCKQS